MSVASRYRSAQIAADDAADDRAATEDQHHQRHDPLTDVRQRVSQDRRDGNTTNMPLKPNTVASNASTTGPRASARRSLAPVTFFDLSGVTRHE